MVMPQPYNNVKEMSYFILKCLRKRLYNIIYCKQITISRAVGREGIKVHLGNIRCCGRGNIFRIRIANIVNNQIH